MDYIEGLNSLPTHMHGAITRWIENGIEPGSFLTAVLENDLFGAVGRADSTNIHALPAYVLYFYNDAPSACWGSVEKVSAWRGLKVNA